MANPTQLTTTLTAVALLSWMPVTGTGASVDLVPRAAPGWKYFLGTNEASIPSTLWRLPGFADTEWSDGALAIGYGTDLNGLITTVNTPIPDANAPPPYTTLFLRKTFTVPSPTRYVQLNVKVWVDDGAIIWLNGVELGRVNVPPGELTYSDAALLTGEVRHLTVTTNSTAILQTGENVIALMAFSIAGVGASADFLVDASLSGITDDLPPTLGQAVPAPYSAVTSLEVIEVVFTEPVSGVDASDLLVNDTPAIRFTAVNPTHYTFQIAPASTGQVQVTWAPNHGITDLADTPNPFAGTGWTYIIIPPGALPNLAISEFMAANSSGIRDEDGDTPDWVEIFNLNPFPVNLEGWYLTDSRANLVKWRFPERNVAPLGFLVVFASDKNRTSGTNLHTNFKLDAGGEYLGLVKPDGRTVAWEYAPLYPRQTNDISYGVPMSAWTITDATPGYLFAPTPARPNTAGAQEFAPDPVFSLPGGIYTNDILSVSLTSPSGEIHYTTDGTTPIDTSPIFTAPLVLANSTTIKARVVEPNKFPGPVVSQTYNLLDSGLSNAFSSTLPIVIVNTHGVRIADGLPAGATNRTRATLAVIDVHHGRASLADPPEFMGLCQIEGRGQTSTGFAKAPYNLEINDANGNDLDVGLLGLPPESDWVLGNPYTDKPFLQEFLAFELHEQMGHYAVRRRFVEVFLDTDGGRIHYPGNYWGVYVLTERIKVDENRVNTAVLGPGNNSEPEISGGYMFKKDKDGAGDLNFSTTRQNLKIVEPKPKEITTPQLNWIRAYLNQMEAALYATDWLTRTGTNHYSHFLDVDSFIDYHWIVELTKQVDGYRLSTYFTKDRDGKVRMEPLWDWDLSFGNADYLEGGRTNGWYYALLGEADHIWLRRLISAPGDPDFNQKITDRWSELRTNVLHLDRLLDRIDELAALLDEPAARDFARFPRLGAYIWPNPNGGTAWDVDYVNPTSYAEIIAQMKGWVRGRHRWIDAQFLQTPILNHPGGTVTNGFSLQLSSPQGTIYYTVDGSDPRLPGGGLSSIAINYAEPITISNNLLVTARARLGNSWSGPAQALFLAQTIPLSITEIMFHPADPPLGSTLDDDDFEFVELLNTGPTALNLDGCRFTNGIAFTFSNLVLEAGQRCLVVKHRDAFAFRYGPNLPVAGQFEGNLSNEGERLTLLGPLGEIIADVAYNAQRHPVTDGLGFSLVAVPDGIDPSPFAGPRLWRVSTELGGSPGQLDPTPPDIPAVVINEILAHSQESQLDAIELHNPADTAADISGWFLTDNPTRPAKFQFGPATAIPPNGYLALDEFAFNPVNVLGAFSLANGGESVYLFSADLAGNLTGYAHGFEFGPSEPNVTLGRHLLSTGDEHIVPLKIVTFLAPNSELKIGPIIISEVMYQPPGIFYPGWFYPERLADNPQDEFIELLNITPDPIPLASVALGPDATPSVVLSNRWRLAGPVQFEFDTNLVVPPNSHLLVVPFDPQSNLRLLEAFRARYAVSENVPILGPYQGALNNHAAKLALLKPVLDSTNQLLSVVVDQVGYTATAPWPIAAAGLGPSLQRSSPNLYGNDPAHWIAAKPSPGRPPQPGAPPAITQHPTNLTVIAPDEATFRVAATGSDPLQYQWLFNGVPLPGATNQSLSRPKTETSHRGLYQVIVLNDAGSAVSETAHLTVIVGVSIVGQPQPVEVRQGTSVTFRVEAFSSTPISYQWRFNGQPIPGANGSDYSILSVSRDNDGHYDAILSDAVRNVVTEPARLTILIDPTFVRLTTNYSAVQGGDILLSVETDGTLPMGYRWRRRTTRLTNEINVHAHRSFRRVTNLQPTTSGPSNFYSVIVTNRAFFQPGAQSPNILISLLADNDGDTLPDDWETQHGLDPASALDKTEDADADGVSNADEYISGTDPQDPSSYLRIESLSIDAGANLVFQAAAGRTYSVLHKPSLATPEWTKLEDIAASPEPRTVVVHDPNPTAPRFYRLETPRQP